MSQAMHVLREWAQGAIRFSIGRMTTAEEIDRAAGVALAAVKRGRKNFDPPIQS